MCWRNTQNSAHWPNNWLFNVECGGMSGSISGHAVHYFRCIAPIICARATLRDYGLHKPTTQDPQRWKTVQKGQVQTVQKCTRFKIQPRIDVTSHSMWCLRMSLEASGCTIPAWRFSPYFCWSSANKENSSGILIERIRLNKENVNKFDTNVLRCEYCKRLFFGGKGENDVKLFQEHLSKYVHHRLPKENRSICNTEWAYEFEMREREMLAKYEEYYSQEQKRAYDAVLKGQKNLVLMGVAGSGKSTLLQDIKYVLECVFWKRRNCTVAQPMQFRNVWASRHHHFTVFWVWPLCNKFQLTKDGM